MLGMYLQGTFLYDTKKPRSALWLLQAQKSLTKNLSYTGPEDRTKQGTTVVPLKIGWDHHVKFYWRKCEIFWPKFSDFTT